MKKPPALIYESEKTRAEALEQKEKEIEKKLKEVIADRRSLDARVTKRERKHVNRVKFVFGGFQLALIQKDPEARTAFFAALKKARLRIQDLESLSLLFPDDFIAPPRPEKKATS